MARKKRVKPRAADPDVQNYWPMPASPTIPPTVNFYYMRKFADGTYDVPGSCVVFLHAWQAGVFLRELLEDAEEVEPGPLRQTFPGISDGRVGSSLDYLIPTERDEEGVVTKGRRFECSLLGVTYEEALELAEEHEDSRVPFALDSQRRSALGMRPRSYAAWENGDDASSVQLAPPKAEKQKREKREKVERAPRASRDGLTSLTSICAEEKVEASDVRAVLRQMKIEKPATGWAWETVPDYVAKAIKKAKEKK